MILIDPHQTRARGAMEPAFDAAFIDTFRASHLLAFGTDYPLAAYRDEMEARLNDSTPISFPNALGDNISSYYDPLIRRLALEGSREAVWHYLSSRSLSLPLRNAGQTLQEAALRGAISVKGRRDENTDLANLGVEDWQDRGWLQVHTGVLYQKREIPMTTVEWFDLTFDRREVVALRDADWHNVTVIAAAPTPSLATKDRLRFTYDPANLRLCLERMAADGKAVTLGEFSRRMASLWLERGGENRSTKGLAGLVESIEKSWIDKRDTAETLKVIAEKG